MAAQFPNFFVYALVFILSGCSAEKFLSRLQVSKNSETQQLNRVVKPLGHVDPIDTREKLKSAESANAIYHFLVGMRLSGQDKPEEAHVSFERVRSLDESSSYIHYTLARENLKRGRLEEGVAQARKAVELDPKNRDYKLLLANLFATAKKNSEAKVLFEEILKDNPEDEEVFLYTVLMEIEDKNYPRARNRLTEYTQRNPESALAYFYLGRLEQELGQDQKAIAHYKKALDLKSGFVQAGTYLGLLQESAGDVGGALETYSWLADQTDGATFHKKIGDIYLDKNEFSRALEAYQNNERKDPSDANNKVKIALILVQLKDYKKAVKKFEEILGDNSDSDTIQFYLATLHSEMKNYSRAAAVFEKVPEGSKFYMEAVKGRLVALAKNGQKEEALKIWDRLLVKATEDKVVSEELLEAGLAFMEEAQMYEQALSLIEVQQKDFPSSDRLVFLKGVVQEKMGQWESAVETMKPLLVRNKNNPSVLNFIGYIWADNGVRLSEAETYIRRALQLKPNDPYILDSLGWVQYKKGLYKEALETLEKAHKIKPDESIVADHMGDTLLKLGKVEQAEKYYKMALDLGPEKSSDKQNLEAKIEKLQNSKSTSSLVQCDENAKSQVAAAGAVSQCPPVTMLEPGASAERKPGSSP